jgi:outer membrane lipoprotein
MNDLPTTRRGPARFSARARQHLLAIGFIAITGCSVHPVVDLASVDTHIAPAQATSSGQFLGRTVNWGGRIVKTVNGRSETTLEILWLPVDRAGRPESGQSEGPRFLAVVPNFLDPEIYAPGRLVSVVGTVGEPIAGAVGGAPYQYARLQTREIALIARAAPGGVYPTFSVGVGIGL